MPEITSVFDVDFWLTEIPQTCHVDPAIWHATVSIGAVHEKAISLDRESAYIDFGSEFAIRQFNAAIGHIVRPSDRLFHRNEQWRALIVSVLFTYQCSIQGLYTQSNVHLTAAKRLMNEFEKARRRAAIPACHKGLPSELRDAKFEAHSVSYASLLTVVANLETHTHVMQTNDAGGVSALFSDLDAYTSWRYYSAPIMKSSQKLCQHGKCVPSRATPANLNWAGKATKSLMYELMASSQKDAGDVVRLVLGDQQDRLKALIEHQTPYYRAYRELNTAINAFVSDTTIECSCFEPTNPGPTSVKFQKRAINALRLYQATCYPMLFNKPTVNSNNLKLPHPLLVGASGLSINNARGYYRTSNSHNLEALAEHLTEALDLAESLLHEEAPPRNMVTVSGFTPPLPATMPLFLISGISDLNGLSPNLGHRAVKILRRYPKREVLWDSSFAAALIELTLSLEIQGPGDEAALPVGLLRKVFGITAEFKDEHEHCARVTVQTWEDWIANRRGRNQLLRWRLGNFL